jgi:hypothetical protein
MNIGSSNHSFRHTASYELKPSAVALTKANEPLEQQDGYQTNGDLDWVDAGQMLREQNIDPDNHKMMRENLATYLSHRTDGIPSERWQNKIDREMKTPYTDDQVFAHVETLEDSMQANISELPSYPSKVYITGSFAKGRLGANSDLDGFAVLPKDDMAAGFDSYVAREKNSTAANMFPLADTAPGYARGHLMFSGQSVEMTPDQIMVDGSMTKAYKEILKGRNIDRRETSNSFEWITGKLWGEDKSAEDKRDAFESKSIKTRIQNAVMSLGGTLSMTPLVGPVVMWVTDKFASQKHLDFTGNQA